MEKLIRSPVPLYYQLENIIRERIKKGEWAHGSPIPSENELSETYEVSRQTVRHALKNLANEELLNPVPGKGYFVTPKKQWFESEWLIESLDDLLVLEKKARYKSLNIEFASPDPTVSKRLSLQDDAKVACFEGVWSVKGSKLAHSIIYLPWKQDVPLPTEERVNSSLSEVLSSYHDRVWEARLYSAATVADGELAQILDVYEGEPILLMERNYLAKDETPVMYARLYYPSKFYTHLIRLVRKP